MPMRLPKPNLLAVWLILFPVWGLLFGDPNLPAPARAHATAIRSVVVALVLLVVIVALMMSGCAAPGSCLSLSATTSQPCRP